MRLIMADNSVTHPVGIIENFPVKVGKFFIPGDFVILDIEVINDKTPIIFGRPFLATVGVNIDLRNDKISLTIGEEKIEYEYLKDNFLEVYKNPPQEPVKVACYNIEVEPAEEETHTDIAQLSEETLEVKSLIVGDAAKDMKGRDPKKKKRDRAKVEIKSGDKVMLFHERSNMFPGSKGT